MTVSKDHSALWQGKDNAGVSDFEMKIKKANREDADEVTALTLRSKDYWNYGAEQIEEWRAELTITSAYIDSNKVFKITYREKIVGFYAYKPTDSKVVNLNFLFIEPDFIGQGIGKRLIVDFLNRIEEEGFERATVDADPNAEKFYEKYGFSVIRKLETAIKNRFLPVMEWRLKLA